MGGNTDRAGEQSRTCLLGCRQPCSLHMDDHRTASGCIALQDKGGGGWRGVVRVKAVASCEMKMCR